EEAKRGIEALRLLKQAKAEAKKAGDDKEEDDKERASDVGRSGSITINGSIIRRSTIGAGAIKKCPHCGAALPKYASFCGECGGKL
ncbi:MAG: zinc ribbon domain-containing protein, partial [Candidatus Methanoperedens sp.]|nr:zinc ribbon domain-containing protein [Candidatus Methanoperedens sp.]